MTKKEKKEIQPVILVILDGWGIAPASKGNAISCAQIPFYDSLLEKYSHTELLTHGKHAGLPKNQPGNSEAGHLNLGAGRIIKDDAVYITESIEDGTFFKNPAFLEGIKYFEEHHSQVHLMGLVTEENSAHSSPLHWLSMIRFLDQKGVKKVFLHLFTDGRDSGQHAAVKILERFQEDVKNNHNHFNNRIKVEIASVVGRFYAMDRTNQWENIEKAYNLLTQGKGLKASSAKEAIIQAYNREETDEFISPTVIVNKEGKPKAVIDNHDLVFFMNLRSDRARELTKVFSQNNFNQRNEDCFKRKKYLDELFFVALTDFGPDLDEVRTAYPSREIENSLPVALKGINQYYIAEAEKFAHVTFFFNGGYDHLVGGEKRIMIPSPETGHYDQTPKMSAQKVCQTLIKEIKDHRPEFAMVNFCNPDMLGHTGDLKATIKSLEFLDQRVKELVHAAQKKGYYLIITADHGNVEEMINPRTKEIMTTHTINPVPFILVSPEKKKIKLKKQGILADVAPTILDLMKVKKPKEMSGHSLIK